MLGFELRYQDMVAQFTARPMQITILRAGRRLPWVIDMSASRITTRGMTGGEAPQTQLVPFANLALRQLSPTVVQWIGRAYGAGIALEVRLGEEGLCFFASPTSDGDAEVVSLVWPGDITVQGLDRELCWSNYSQGALFRSDGKPWKCAADWPYHAMRLFGLTCQGQSLACIVHTPHDARTDFTDDGAAKMTATTEFLPSLGTLAYPREIRLLPLDEPGHLAVANAFRRYAQAQGMWMPWAQRVAESPEVARLQGAFVACAGYYHDDGADQVAAMRTMKKMGFEHGYLFSTGLYTQKNEFTPLGERNNDMSDDMLQQVQELGYICAPFLQVEEAGPTIGMHNLATDDKGQPVQRWAIGDQQYFEIAKWRVHGMIAAMEDKLQVCSGIHFDTLTAMNLIEHCGHRPYDRRGDAQLRLELARHFRRRGKVVCAESMRDWAVTTVDLATAKQFTPVWTHDNRVWNVPLTDLVYHDSLMRINWEHHPYDDTRCIHTMTERKYHFFGNYLTDLLTASPPVLFPEGRLYEFEHKEVMRNGRLELDVVTDNAHVYRKRISDPLTQAALPLALRVCRMNQRHGTARMIRHQFIDSVSPLVQESEFSTGLHVVVNFGDQPYTLGNGRTVEARSAVVEN